MVLSLVGLQGSVIEMGAQNGNVDSEITKYGIETDFAFPRNDNIIDKNIHFKHLVTGLFRNGLFGSLFKNEAINVLNEGLGLFIQ